MIAPHSLVRQMRAFAVCNRASVSACGLRSATEIKTTYGYDGLNHNTTVSYSDSTPGVTRTYDTATLGKGRFQKTETAGGAGSRVTINAYDAMGRPLSQGQQFFYLGAWGSSYTTQCKQACKVTH